MPNPQPASDAADLDSPEDNPLFDRMAAVAALPRPTHDINHVIAYGQSLSTGYEGWPALSRTQPYDSLMLGDSVRSVQETDRDWQPTGARAFRPLVATVQDLREGRLLTEDEVAALKPDTVVLGETVLEGALNAWRGRMLAHGAVLGRKQLLGSSCGLGCRTLEQLSKGSSPEAFDRLRACVRLAQDIALSDARNYGISAILFLQGEFNSRGIQGSTKDYEGYRELLQRLHDDIALDVVRGVAGQSRIPAFFSYQTGGAYAADANAVQQAQLDFTLRMPGCFMVAPVYPLTEKGGHLDANGYRWLGHQFGKVMYRVLTLGQDWRPLYPLRAVWTGRQVTLDFHVPVPPLAWGTPVFGHTMRAVKDHGFRVVDHAGVMPVQSVELAGDARVVIGLGRDVRGGVTVRYADRTIGGRGALHDSDAEVATDCYESDPGKGHYASANIPELAGKPYPLQNWCVAFAIEATRIDPPAPPPVSAVAPQPVGAAWGVLRAPGLELPEPRPAPRPPWRPWHWLFGGRR